MNYCIYSPTYLTDDVNVCFVPQQEIDGLTVSIPSSCV